MNKLVNNLYWNRKGGWGVCDLYPLGGHAEKWFRRMGLSEERPSRVQFCCKGSIIAEGTIETAPRSRTPADPPVADPNFPSVVTITKIDPVNPPKPCECYQKNRRRGSHLLTGKGPCS